MNKDLNELKNKVQSFLQDQPGYHSYKDENLHAFVEDPQDIGVIFGRNLQAGIGGFGQDVERAYQDFLIQWKDLGGFEWILNNR